MFGPTVTAPHLDSTLPLFGIVQHSSSALGAGQQRQARVYALRRSGNLASETSNRGASSQGCLCFVFGEGDACHADIAVDNREADGFQALALAWPFEAFSRRKLEQRAVLTADNALASGLEKLVGLPVEVDAIMRAAVDVAEDLLAPAHHENVPGLLGLILVDRRRENALPLRLGMSVAAQIA